MIRLGGPVFGDCSDPDRWIEAVQRQGYAAAFCPLDHTADSGVVRAYELAARKAGIAIAEVGAWSSPMSRHPKARAEAREHCKRQLALADRIGARCCVNVAGSLGPEWAGPHPDDLTPEAFDGIVECVREILDDVQPTRTFYALETMPWMYPDSPESYLKLIKAIDRPHFGVHLDPVNLVKSPQHSFCTGALIKECIEKLGSWIKSCHAKDVRLETRALVHLEEVRPGTGQLDYRTFLEQLDRLAGDVPLMLEHLPSEEEYRAAATYLRYVGKITGVSLSG